MSYDWKLLPKNPSGRFLIWWDKMQQYVAVESILCCLEGRICDLEEAGAGQQGGGGGDVEDEKCCDGRQKILYRADGTETIPAVLRDDTYYLLHMDLVASNGGDESDDRLAVLVEMLYNGRTKTVDSWKFLDGVLTHKHGTPEEVEFVQWSEDAPHHDTDWSLVIDQTPLPLTAIAPGHHTVGVIITDPVDESYVVRGHITIVNEVGPSD